MALPVDLFSLHANFIESSESGKVELKAMKSWLGLFDMSQSDADLHTVDRCLAKCWWLMLVSDFCLSCSGGSRQAHMRSHLSFSSQAVKTKCFIGSHLPVDRAEHSFGVFTLCY